MKIAVEEAFATPELLSIWKQKLGSQVCGEGFSALYRPLLESDAMGLLRSRLLDCSEIRLAEMDKFGIDVQILSVTAPGVQILEEKEAKDLTIMTNDYLATVIQKHPDRFLGLMAIPPDYPSFSVSEIERVSKHGGMVGIIINSHSNGAFLDENRYLPIFEIAEDLGLPIYLHPTFLSSDMVKPFLKYGLAGPIWGFAVDTSLHAMRLILSGTFDRFPNLKVILGHMGEGIPFWLHRIDSRLDISKAFDETGQVAKLKLMPSDYIKNNFFFSTSGMNTEHALRYTMETTDKSKIMFAIDYPYESTEEAVKGIENSSLTASEKEDIYFRNANKIFNLDF